MIHISYERRTQINSQLNICTVKCFFTGFCLGGNKICCCTMFVSFSTLQLIFNKNHNFEKKRAIQKGSNLTKSLRRGRRKDEY